MHVDVKFRMILCLSHPSLVVVARTRREQELTHTVTVESDWFWLFFFFHFFFFFFLFSSSSSFSWDIFWFLNYTEIYIKEFRLFIVYLFLNTTDSDTTVSCTVTLNRNLKVKLLCGGRGGGIFWTCSRQFVLHFSFITNNNITVILIS